MATTGQVPLTGPGSHWQPPKRKRSGKDDEEGRIVKHRASKACRSCRTRKVRCDVSAKGARCTNCELDGLECVVLPSRRGQSNRIRRESNAPFPPPPRAETEVRQSSYVTVYPQTRQPRAERAATDPPDTGNVPAVVTFDEDVDNPEQEPGLETASGQANGYDALLTPDTATTSGPAQQDQQSNPKLPHFIARIPAHILPEDQEFLEKKGAFVLPDPDLRDEILEAYLFSVHPFMPLLEVDPFVRAVQLQEGQVSLLLFQAVMFAGIHSLKPESVQRLGFRTVKQAREVFFNRARLLYDFNVEVDDHAILQSLILMSSWYSKRTPWNEKRHTWHWTGLAYDLARSIGLHREPSHGRMPVEQQRFRRRLWWSLYIRDRLIALGTRRPMRIHDNEYDVAMLTLEDFDLQSGRSSAQGTNARLSDEEATSTALMCIQLARLCVCIGHVVSSQYTTIGSQAGTSHTMMVMPRRDGDHTEELRDCEQELLAWDNDLASNVRRSEFLQTNSPRRCSEVHFSQLNMTYLTVVNVLHRAQALRSQSRDEDSGSQSKSKVKTAARSITKLGQEMLQRDQVRFLGLIGVTAFLAACLTHMLDAGSADEDVRDASTFRLYQTLQALQALREVYASADSAFSFLSSVTRKAGIYMPVQADSPTVAFMSASPNARTAAALTRPSQPTSSNSWSASGGRREKSIDDGGYGLYALPHSATQNVTTRYPPIEPGPDSRTASTSALPCLTYDDRDASGLRSIICQNATLPAQFGGANNGQISNDADSGFGVSTHAPFGGSGAFDWSAGGGTGFDWGYMPFTYDFFSDAFGFLDGELSGL